ncbi:MULTISPECIES: hypothetical protein [Bacillales]|nr:MULTISPECIES: hypothetical protein [Bacillales]REK62002.1 MAG: hypothetical protein DF221_14365 [Brevibacillus sp.]MBR8661578.1 hypothetical protein [Brevibacillus sp. NL20B1]MDT3417931.1 hypothetical protein [Brevibacillus aydinogluensis]NNV03000.1 hypothetical protein [Brevibacillus sp. MCWH]UFJ59621.1 hypothetical protein IRT44_09705 [Anoxybacillus sediminis]
MGKWTTLVGGLVGGWSFLKIPLEGTFLSFIDPVVDGVGIVAAVVFSGALIYYGVRDWIQG